MLVPVRPYEPLVFLLLAAASAVFAYVTGRFTRRLDRLRYTAERINLRDLSVRVSVEGNDAVAALARSFNRMLDRLAAEERARRQLFADVAHEDRHPLAVLRGRLESIQDGVLPLDSEQILLLHDTVIGLTRLVGDLRDLSLADVGQLSLNLSSVDLADLVDQLRENLEPVAEDRGTVLNFRTAADIPRLTADADRLRQVPKDMASFLSFYLTWLRQNIIYTYMSKYIYPIINTGGHYTGTLKHTSPWRNNKRFSVLEDEIIYYLIFLENLFGCKDYDLAKFVAPYMGRTPASIYAGIRYHKM